MNKSLIPILLMTLSKISIFLTPNPREIITLTALLGKHNINGITLRVNRSQTIDTIRILVDKPNEAMSVLSSHDYIVKLSESVGIEIDDTPGSFSKLLEIIEASGVELISFEIFPSRTNTTKAIALIQTEDNQKIESTARSHNYTIIGDSDLVE